MASNKTIVTITSIPTKFESYYMWFIYGFYELERQGKIKFRLPFALSINNRYIQGLRRRICASDNTTYCLIGNIQKDGKVRQFCIDCADNPSNINSELLAEVDVYFKMQCLKEYDSRGFILNSHITLKYLSVNEGDSFKDLGEWIIFELEDKESLYAALKKNLINKQVAGQLVDVVFSRGKEWYSFMPLLIMKIHEDR